MRDSRSQAAVLKDRIYPSADESSVTVEQLAAAIWAATAMDIKEKERVCDTIHATQPNLLASVLALRSFGISMPTIEIVLNILIVLHLAIVESGQVLATVTEDDQDREAEECQQPPPCRAQPTLHGSPGRTRGGRLARLAYREGKATTLSFLHFFTLPASR